MKYLEYLAYEHRQRIRNMSRYPLYLMTAWCLIYDPILPAGNRLLSPFNELECTGN